MKEIIFVTGGCRSGKSTYALQVAEKMPGDQKIFIATCVPQDDEMKQRVAKHQTARSKSWKTVEEPLKLAETMMHSSQRADVILIDCLTLWVSNLLMNTDDEKHLEAMIARFIDVLENTLCPVVLVSNEVGSGIVPENPLARQFRDITGWVNQAVAKCANKVVWMVAGIPVTVKG